MTSNKQIKGSNTWGYPSKLPCVVCKQFNGNQSEPRFGYTVCKNHQYLSPVEINKMRTDGQ